MFSCAIDIPSKTDEQRLSNLRTWYQIPDKLNPRLPVCEEWCCDPFFGIGVYKAYLLGGLRFPLNAFIRELLVRLGLGVCQFNPNAWRLVISIQVLWREVFERDLPLTVDEFLYCYKPSEIHQSLGFYQFTARGKDCRMIRSLPSSDKKWKTEFFSVSDFWAGNPSNIGRDTFGHYTEDLRNLRLQGKSLFFFFNYYYFYILTRSFTAIRRPSLSKFHRDRVHRARLHADRNFHSLITFRRLAKWGLGPSPSEEALAHEITVRRSKL